jgi:transcriptional regulator with XRE-family HTH domain
MYTGVTERRHREEVKVEEKPQLKGSRVRELRERLGLTQEELAKRAGLERSHISQMESGRRANVEAWVLARLAAALNTSMDYLLGLTDNPLPARYWSYFSELKVDERLRRFLLLPEEAQSVLAEFLKLLQSYEDNERESGEAQG